MRILLADDHALIRAGLRRLFELAPDIEVAGEAADGAQVLQRLRAGGVDLLLLDIHMPGLSGIDLIARVHAHYPALPILVLSVHAGTALVQRALAAGARGYLTKDQDPQALLAALRRVAAGGRALCPLLAERLALERFEPAPAHQRLSPREWQVLQLLAQGLGVNAIAARLAISNKTVSTHKAKLMEKMGFASLADLVAYALAQGWRGSEELPSPPQPIPSHDPAAPYSRGPPP